MINKGKSREIKLFFNSFVDQKKRKDFFSGKIILDAGCGNGEYIQALCESLKGTKFKIVGIDNNADSVKIAKNRNRDFGKVSIIKGDITECPFRENAFDIIYSAGVIHYTSKPEETFLKLTKSLKNKGKMAIWVYPKKNLVLDKVQIILRSFTTRLPRKLLYYLCFIITPLLFFFRTHSGKNLINSSWRECADTVFAFYSQKYLQFNSYETVLGWFRKAGLKNIEKMPEPVGVKGVK